MDTPNQQQTPRHVLLIHDQPEPRQVLLEGATYSIGRDKRNSITIVNKAISRQHALLLRVPTPQPGQYRYRIFDGNAAGKPSLNGMRVNGEKCTSQDLKPGDIVLLGDAIRIEYRLLAIPTGTYMQYLNIQTPEQQRLKAKPLSNKDTAVPRSPNLAQPISARETLIDEASLADYEAENPLQGLLLGEGDSEVPDTVLFSKRK